MTSRRDDGGSETLLKRQGPAVLVGVLALILTVSAYRPALDSGFYFDDNTNLVRAPALHWSEVSLRAARDLWTNAHLPTRFVANLTLALNHAAAGLRPMGYHAVNVVIHLLVGLAVFVLIRAYEGGTRSGAPGGGTWPQAAGPAAALAAALFLVHPLNTQAVTYVVQRMASLAALFCIVAFTIYLLAREHRSGRSAWYLGATAVPIWLLGMGCKENAALLPFVLIAYEACFHRDFWRARWNALGNRGRLALFAACVTAAAVLVSVFGSSFRFTHTWDIRDFNGWERILTQLRVQWLYLGLLIWPSPGRLTLEHDVAVSRSLLDPVSTLVAGLLWVVALGGVLVLCARWPRYGFPLAAYLIWHSLESGPVNLELVFEHRMYLPMTMVALLAGVVLADVGGGRLRHLPFIALALTLPMARATWERNRVWADEEAFFRDTAIKAPNKFRPWYNLGTFLGREGRIEEARGPLERAAQLDPEHSEVNNQLGNIYLLSGKAQQALEAYRKAVRLTPENMEARYNLAALADQLGLNEEAVRNYRAFIEAAPPPLAEYAARARVRVGQLEKR
ncbi:MAG TPA: tetratricopeptide repeat protein [Longimicrobiales bacterium]|nr:tetratricopeptide repeat protein [Longimicrobiales bacterium]